MSKRKHDDVPSEWKTLVLDYLEKSLTDEQFQEMRKLIEKPAFQRMLADYAIDQSILRELTRSEELVEGLEKSPDFQKIATQRSASTDSPVAKWLSGRMAVFAAISAMLLVAITGALSPHWNSTLPAGADAIQIQSVVGTVSIENKLADAGMFLEEGKLISTDDIASFARISYADGTVLVLAGSSAIVCSSNNGQKLIQIKQGNISASVSPQPTGKPLLIETDAARIEVVGTNLAISANQLSTRLDVTEGKVKIQERSLGNQADVSAGDYAVANVGEKIEVSQQSITPDTWEIDFEEGLPEGWQQGTWVQKGSPNGVLLGNRSMGAVMQAFSNENVNYSIMSPNAWSAGQFRICENSYLQFRVKMERPDWYQVMLVTRDEGFRTAGFQGVYEYQEPNTINQPIKRISPNVWRTVRIPLSSFKRTNPRKYPSIETPFGQRPSDPPRIDDVVFTLFFSSQNEDRGLVIDDISVTVD